MGPSQGAHKKPSPSSLMTRRGTSLQDSVQPTPSNTTQTLGAAPTPSAEAEREPGHPSLPGCAETPEMPVLWCGGVRVAEWEWGPGGQQEAISTLVSMGDLWVPGLNPHPTMGKNLPSPTGGIRGGVEGIQNSAHHPV